MGLPLLLVQLAVAFSSAKDIIEHAFIKGIKIASPECGPSLVRKGVIGFLNQGEFFLYA